jgi:hypothetical protein
VRQYQLNNLEQVFLKIIGYNEHSIPTTQAA